MSDILGNVFGEYPYVISTLEPLFGRRPPISLFHPGAIELYTEESKSVYPTGTDLLLGGRKTHLIPLPLNRHSVNCLINAPYTIY